MAHQRRKAQRPAEILEAALDVFADVGLLGAKLSEIATRAGISRPTLYLYYPNKTAIFIALIQTHILPMLAQVEHRIEEADVPADVLLEQVLRRFYQQSQNPDTLRVIRLLINEGSQLPEMTNLYAQQVIHPSLALLQRILQRGVDEGVFRTAAALLDARVLVAPALMGVIWNTTFTEQAKFDAQETIKAHLALLRSE